MEYFILIAASIIIILSHAYNGISRKTNIPSVLLLIVTGIIARETLGLTSLGYESILSTIREIRLIELLGTMGLIMIVLEAALDLKLSRDRAPLIFRAFISGLVVLLVTNFVLAGILFLSYPEFTYMQAMIYANPLSILSSAIVIPSVAQLDDKQREFHIYDSTFSDILGIMLFYFLITLNQSSSESVAVGQFSFSLLITVVVSFVFSYLLIYFFQNLVSKVKLFVMISVLLLLYSVGKLMHLSSLIIILIFGLILSNPSLFFHGPLRKFLNSKAISDIYATFHVITMETAFVVRTFFFFIFGYSISVLALFDLKVAVISTVILALIYAIRAGILLVVSRKTVRLATCVAPRGLITLLLFYSIPPEIANPHFQDGILVFVIIITSMLMTFGLIKFSHQDPEDVELEITNPRVQEPSEK